MNQQPSNSDDFYWHESGGARILIPNELGVVAPFPELYAKATGKLRSVIVLITNCPTQRSLAESSMQQPPRGTPSILDVRIIRNASVSLPFPGKALILETEAIENPVPLHSVLQVLELDTATGVFAVISAQAEGSYKESEASWKAVIDSFSWDRATGQFLKFNGDEFVHRKRHKQKTPRKKRARLPKLPASLRYLQPVVDELLSLPPEEIHEDIDLPNADRLLQKRTHGLSRKQAIDRLNKDCDALKVWIEQDRPNRDNAEFLRGMLEYTAVFALLKRLNLDRTGE